MNEDIEATLLTANKEILASLGHDYDTCVQTARTGSDPETLVQMANDILDGNLPDVGGFSAALVANLCLPFEAARTLAAAQRGVFDFGMELISRPDVTPKALDEWSDDLWSTLTSLIVHHPKTSIRTLIKMTKNANDSVVAQILCNQHLPAKYVDSFSTHGSKQVRSVVAAKSSSPIILRLLAADADEGVRIRVMENPHAAADLIEQVAVHDKSIVVVAVASKRVTDDKILHQVGGRMSSGGWEPHTADQLMRLARAIMDNPASPDWAKAYAALLGG